MQANTPSLRIFLFRISLRAKSDFRLSKPRPSSEQSRISWPRIPSICCNKNCPPNQEKTTVSAALLQSTVLQNRKSIKCCEEKEKNYILYNIIYNITIIPPRLEWKNEKSICNFAARCAVRFFAFSWIRLPLFLWTLIFIAELFGRIVFFAYLCRQIINPLNET